LAKDRGGAKEGERRERRGRRVYFYNILKIITISTVLAALALVSLHLRGGREKYFDRTLALESNLRKKRSPAPLRDGHRKVCRTISAKLRHHLPGQNRKVSQLQALGLMGGNIGSLFLRILDKNEQAAYY
jgi:hypothetical protein